MRKALPVGNITTHVEKLIQMQINSEADRITAIIQKMDRPNDPRGTYHMAAVSNQFLAKTSREDIDQADRHIAGKSAKPIPVLRRHWRWKNPMCLSAS